MSLGIFGSTEPLLPARELGKLLGVTKETVLEWARERGCPHIQLVQGLRFRVSEVERWIEQRQFEKKVGSANG